VVQGEAKLQAILDLYGHHADHNDAADRCLILVRRRLESLRQQAQAQAKFRLEFLRGRLQEAREQRAHNPARAVEICRAIVVLYGDKPWAAEEVRQAEQMLAELRAGTSFRVPCPRLSWACFATNMLAVSHVCHWLCQCSVEADATNMLAVSLRSLSKHGTRAELRGGGISHMPKT
jgi:hypothetical protein